MIDLYPKDPSILKDLIPVTPRQDKQREAPIPGDQNRSEHNGKLNGTEGRERTTSPSKTADYWRGYSDALHDVIERLQKVKGVNNG